MPSGDLTQEPEFVSATDRVGFLTNQTQRGRVTGVRAIGDGTNHVLEQGGLTAQEADLAARAIVARALGRDAPNATAPVLRGMLPTGKARLWLQHDPGDADDGLAADDALWWPPSRIAGSRLGGYLTEPQQDHTAGADVPKTTCTRARPDSGSSSRGSRLSA